MDTMSGLGTAVRQEGKQEGRQEEKIEINDCTLYRSIKRRNRKAEITNILEGYLKSRYPFLFSSQSSR